jgi:FixJ family two-component response regulator
MTFDPTTISPITVAIVDDEDSVRTGLRRLCGALGLRAASFASGRIFIAALESGVVPPDCLLLDAQMAQMNGLDVHRRLLELGLHIPTIIYTGDDAPQVKADYLEAGVAAYLRKPIAGDALIAAVEQVVTWQRPARADVLDPARPSPRR